MFLAHSYQNLKLEFKYFSNSLKYIGLFQKLTVPPMWRMYFFQNLNNLDIQVNLGILHIAGTDNFWESLILVFLMKINKRNN